MNKLNDFASQMKAKFEMARILKFDPYVTRNTIVAWPKKANSYVFYKHKFPNHLLGYQNHHHGRGNQGGKLQMIEYSIIEVACERKVFSLRNLINNKGQ